MTRRTQPLPPHWPTIRRHILTRDKTCQLAYPRCTTTPTEVDHITPASQDGTNHDTNLQAVCPTCHATKTGREARATQPNRHRPTEQHPGTP